MTEMKHQEISVMFPTHTHTYGRGEFMMNKVKSKYQDTTTSSKVIEIVIAKVKVELDLQHGCFHMKNWHSSTNSILLVLRKRCFLWTLIGNNELIHDEWGIEEDLNWIVLLLTITLILREIVYHLQWGIMTKFKLSELQEPHAS